MEHKLEIRAGRAVIRGRPSATHPDGLFVGRNGFQGWEGISDRRREQVSRAVEHGEHDVPTFLGSRVVTIDGHVIADTPRTLRRFSQLLTGLGATGDRVKVTVDHQEQTLHAYARTLIAVADDQGVRYGRLLRSTFQLQFVFADPRKYGEQHRYPKSGTATSATAYQYGNFPAHPVIEIPSAPSSYSVTSPGGTFSVTGAPSGGTHRIDMRTGRLTRNGVDITEHVSSGDLWAIPVGGRWTHTLSAPGRVLVPETYV